MAIAAGSVADDAELAQLVVRALACGCGTAAREAARWVATRSLRRTGVGRCCPVPHDERRAAICSGVSVHIRVRRVERTDLRNRRRKAWCLFLQPRCGERRGGYRSPLRSEE